MSFSGASHASHVSGVRNAGIRSCTSPLAPRASRDLYQRRGVLKIAAFCVQSPERISEALTAIQLLGSGVFDLIAERYANAALQRGDCRLIDLNAQLAGKGFQLFFIHTLTAAPTGR